MVLIIVLELLKIQKLLYLKMVNLLVILAEQSARLREETGGYFTLDDLDCIKVKFEIEKPVGDLANKINFDLLNTFFNHQHEMTRSSSVNKTTMKNILNDGRDISIAKLVENTSLIIK